ncbi:DUF397 domain-containing protein [Streptomyces triculaminicus]|uniref:DUF397 domain-containing protein n=2 Tax=Streptomyces TaxID=1883 RepID=A0A939FKF7_9ACTN|nr:MULTISPECIES: DUF397 domain-containing protein [Streptomyces]MBO0652734.1 DUF397 domain-containing protein [Streptomyces triculaminicus]QSY51701.1 DUF397 domain-containing protein [Streptomyces griseocarneus]
MPEIPADLTWIPATDDEKMTEYLEVAFGNDGNVYIRENINPEKVVVTTDAKWDAFVLGVQAGEFDHFVEGIDD